MLNRLPRTAALAAISCLLASPAFAHAHLKSAVPAADSTVTVAPTTIELDFSEGVNLAFTGVKVTATDGMAVATGPGASGPGGDSTLVVPVLKPLAAGRYTVDWHALATDGHKTSGHYTFTIKP